MNKYNWEGINFPSEKDDWKKIEKNDVTIALNVLYAKKEKYILLMFQNIIHSKRRRMALSCTKKTINIVKTNNFQTL